MDTIHESPPVFTMTSILHKASQVTAKSSKGDFPDTRELQPTEARASWGQPYDCQHEPVREALSLSSSSLFLRA